MLPISAVSVFATTLGRHSPEKMTIVSIPERKFAGSPGGRGVVGREGMGVLEREMTPFSFVSFSGCEMRSALPRHTQCVTDSSIGLVLSRT